MMQIYNNKINMIFLLTSIKKFNNRERTDT